MSSKQSQTRTKKPASRQYSTYKAPASRQYATYKAPAARARPQYRRTYVQPQYPMYKPVTSRRLTNTNHAHSSASHHHPNAGTPGFESVGGRVGSTIGNVLGHGAQMLLKSLTGFGDYTIDKEANTMFTGGMEPAEIVNSVNTGGTIFRHREYLRDVLSSSDFESSYIHLNPGQAESFPWLSGIANNYEKYRFRGLVIEFKSLSSNSVVSTSASTGLGSVMMSTNYNVNDPVFINKEQMLNYEYANSRKPSESFYHPVETKNSETPTNQLFVRTGDYDPDADPRLSDLGRFQISTQGMQGTPAVIGELWMTFEVELFTPRTPDNTPQIDIWDISGASLLLPLGPSDRVPYGNLGGLIIDDVNYHFPTAITAGTWMITYYVTDDVLSVPALELQPVPTVTNGVLGEYRGSGTRVQGYNVSVMFLVNVTAPECVITFPIQWLLPDTPNQGYFIVQKYIDNSSGVGGVPSFLPIPEVSSKFQSSDFKKFKKFLAMEAEADKRARSHKITEDGQLNCANDTITRHDNSEEFVSVKKSYLKQLRPPEPLTHR